MALGDYAWLRERTLDTEEGRAGIRKASQIAGVASELGCKPAQLAIAWTLKNPNVSTVILGASRTDQLTENLASLEVVPKLTEKIRERRGAGSPA